MEPDPYLEALRRVTAGRTATFCELARLAGRPAAARAAGHAVASLAPDDTRAWHRIVHGDGSLAPDPARAAVQLERLRAEGARPRAGEEVRAWARRRRARFVGNWRDRAVYDVGDERVPRLDPRRVEALRDEEQTVARGFAFAPPPRSARRPEPARLDFEEAEVDWTAPPRRRSARAPHTRSEARPAAPSTAPLRSTARTAARPAGQAGSGKAASRARSQTSRGGQRAAR